MEVGGERINKVARSGFLRTVLIFLVLIIVSSFVLPKRSEVDEILLYLKLLDFGFRVLIVYVVYGYRYAPMKIGMSLISLSALIDFLSVYLVFPRSELLETLSSLSGCFVVAISLLWLFKDFISEEFHRLLYTDYLTGVLNRQTFVKLASRKLQSLKENETAFLLYLDLDGFKKVNDQFGHSFGDKLLQAAAKRIKSCTRSSDLLGRIGGDEFVLFLAGADVRMAEEVLERINEKLKEPFGIDGVRIELSLSAGVAVYPKDGESLEDLIEASDKAMYRAKSMKRGKERVRGSEEIVG
ncbi:GGDEF domain-containing protein [Pseudothermotoga sp.]